MSLSDLELPPTATEADVKLRYRQLAMKAHPDRGGTVAQFQALQKAYEEALAEVGGVAIDSDLGVFTQVCMDCAGNGYTLRGSGFSTIKFTCSHCGGTGRINK